MAKINRPPLDIIAISLFMFWTASTYFDVDKSLFPLFGLVIKGGLAHALWIVLSVFIVICAVGIFKMKIVFFKVVIVYFMAQMLNTTLNYLLVPQNTMLNILKKNVVMKEGTPKSISYFLFYILILVSLSFYLWKKKGKIEAMGRYEG